MIERGEQPAVSVIVPVYNGAEFLATAVLSVLGQTLRNIEVLIVDDASVDDTVCVAERLADQDPRVRVLRQATNRGQAAARNLALGRARGRWIAPVDADDEIMPDRLRRLVDAGEREDADLIADGILFEGARPPGAPVELMSWGRSGPALETLSGEALIRSGMKGAGRSLGYLKPLMRRKFLDDRNLRYMEDLRFAEDFNLYARALFCGARFLLFPESHYVYWQRSASASRADVSLIAHHALSNSRRLRAVVPATRAAELTAALDEYDQRWSLLAWFEQVRLGVARRRFRQVVTLLLNMPANFGRILRFARDRAAGDRRVNCPE